MIKISVITCTYNAAATLERTLKSVERQSWEAVEHLIVDGQSTDGTLEMAAEYKQKSDLETVGHEVRIVSEPDKGLYDAMNKGLKTASGEYLVFLNAGDTLPSDGTLATVARAAEGTEPLPGVIYGQTDIVDHRGRFLRHRRLQPPRNLSWKSFRNGMLVCHQAFYALTSIARDTPYDLAYRYSADVDWCIRVMKAAEQQGRSLRDTGCVVANYLDGGMTTANHKASLLERFRVMRKHYGLFRTVVQHCWFVVRAVIKAH